MRVQMQMQMELELATACTLAVSPACCALLSFFLHSFLTTPTTVTYRTSSTQGIPAIMTLHMN